MTITHDDATYRHWLDQEVDGALGATDQAHLEAVVATRPDLQQERTSLERLHTLLRDDRIAVRPGFDDAVLSSLPTAAWQRSRRAWLLPVAMLMTFGFGAAVLLAGSGGLGAGPLGTVAALGDFFQATLLAGAGLIGATWRGLGFALDELLAASKLNVAAFAVGVLCLNLLFFRMLRRPQARRESIDGDRS